MFTSKVVIDSNHSMKLNDDIISKQSTDDCVDRSRVDKIREGNNVVNEYHNLGPLVIVIKEVESIPAQVLSDFIELTSIYRTRHFKGNMFGVPIYFVMGLSTTFEAGFEARLNASTLGLLDIQCFSVPPPADFLEVVLNEVYYLKNALKFLD